MGGPVAPLQWLESMQTKSLLIWFSCVVAGAYALTRVDSDYGFLGAFLGALVGWLVVSRARASTELEKRVAELEQAVALLTGQIEALSRGPVPLQAAVHRPEPAVAASHEAPQAPPSLEPAAAPPRIESIIEEPRATAVGSAPLGSPEPVPQSLFRRVFYGSALAKVGAALLLVALGSLLKLGTEYLQASIEARLGGVALLAIAMAVFGWRERGRRKWIAAALTAGGCAMFYLLVYFMWAGYRDWAGGGSLIGATTAFTLLVAIAGSCVLLGWIQASAALIVFAVSGAYAAPLLVGAQGDPWVLFSYYAAASALVFAASAVKDWRYLNLLAFALTATIGSVWAMDLYRPEWSRPAGVFVIVFFVLFSLGPVVHAMLRGARLQHPADAAMVIGTPLVALALLVPLMKPYPYGLAISVLAAGLYYFALCALLRQRPRGDMALMEQAHVLIGVALLTLAVPLAFGITATAAVLAIEGAALAALGLRHDRVTLAATGLSIELGAALYFLARAQEVLRRFPASNEILAGCVVLAIAAFLTSWMLRRHAAQRMPWARLATPVAIWGALWWFGGAISEIARYAPPGEAGAVTLAFLALFAWGMEWLGARMQLHRTRIATALFPYLVIVLALVTLARSAHVLDGWMLWVFPVALVVAYWILHRHERWQLAVPLTLPHVMLAWLVLVVVAQEWVFLVRRDYHAQLWQLVAWGTTLAMFAVTVSVLCIARVWPTRGRVAPTMRACGLPAIALGVLWVLYANAVNSGAWDLDYVPVFNPLDASSTLLLAVGTWMVAAARRLDPRTSPQLHQWMVWALAIGKFWWANATVARTVHHYGGVPYTAPALMSSVFFQAILSVVWTIAALAVMIWGTREASRKTWFVGFGILGAVGVKMVLFDLRHLGTAAWTFSLLGIALLVIAAGYFSPTPPRQSAEQA